MKSGEGLAPRGRGKVNKEGPEAIDESTVTAAVENQDVRDPCRRAGLTLKDTFYVLWMTQVKGKLSPLECRR